MSENEVKEIEMDGLVILSSVAIIYWLEKNCRNIVTFN